MQPRSTYAVEQRFIEYRIMKELVEIRWHGRGGQGAVTASKILAEACLAEGKFIQAFPEYGPERSGAPVKSFTRVSQKQIVIHSQVINPDVVVVLNPTLLDAVNVCEGLREDGILLINSQDDSKNIRNKLKAGRAKVFVVDATGIALKNVGRDIPNTPMIGALAKVTGIVKLESLKKTFEHEFSTKFKPEIMQGNLNSMEAAYKEVREL